MLAECQAVETEVLDLLERQIRGDAPRLDAVLLGEPVAVPMHLDAELRIHTFCRPLAVTAQIAPRAVRGEGANVRIERRLAFGAGGQHAIADQGMHLGAAE